MVPESRSGSQETIFDHLSLHAVPSLLRRGLRQRPNFPPTPTTNPTLHGWRQEHAIVGCGINKAMCGLANTVQSVSLAKTRSQNKSLLFQTDSIKLLVASPTGDRRLKSNRRRSAFQPPPFHHSSSCQRFGNKLKQKGSFGVSTLSGKEPDPEFPAAPFLARGLRTNQVP